MTSRLTTAAELDALGDSTVILTQVSSMSEGLTAAQKHGGAWYLAADWECPLSSADVISEGPVYLLPTAL